MRRRHVIAAGFGALACACCGPLARAAADLPVLCAAAGDATFDSIDRMAGTGTPALDQALTAELVRQSQFFGVRPAFSVYRGAPEGNAMATPYTYPEFAGLDGTVLYQIDLLKKHLASGEWGGSIVAGVIAHEFGHILQYRSGLIDQLHKLDRDGKTVKFVELHADFLAGFYMFDKFKDRSADIQHLARAIYDLGDDQSQSSDHHGTRYERHAALKAGFIERFRNQSIPISEASQYGFVYVRELFPAFE